MLATCNKSKKGGAKQQIGEHKKRLCRFMCYECNKFGHYAGQCPNKKRGKQEKEEQVAATTEIERYVGKFEKEFFIVAVVLSCASSIHVDVGKWIVESAYCGHMT